MFDFSQLNNLVDVMLRHLVFVSEDCSSRLQVIFPILGSKSKATRCGMTTALSSVQSCL